MADAVAPAVAAEAYKDGRNAINFVFQNIKYVKDLGKNCRKMTEEAEKLYARRDDIQAKVNKDKTKRTTKECEAWISRVKKIEEVVLELETKYKKGKKSYNYLLRHDLSKRMADTCEELRVLWAEGKFESEVVAEDLPEPVIKISAHELDDMPSQQSTVEEVLGFLRDIKVRRIGLWGMVGVGKTVIMQNLNDNADIAKMFDLVIWVSLSNDCSIEKLQNAIVRRLKLNMQGIIGLEETAWRISKELECQGYLLLLDEVWHSLDLHAVGIRNNHKHSKVVLATRKLDICYDMEAEQINVKPLSGAEPMKLFRKIVGRSINLPGVEPIAQQVVNECAGLPLLIDRVARTFRKKDNIYLWRDGLRRLRRWPSIEHQGMDEMLEFLKFCYEDLDGDDKKACFLYGALYPENCEIYIDYLLECWRAEGFIQDVYEFRDARDKGYTILHDLINVSLLERSEKMKYVRMNRVLRNMALKISSQSNDSKFLVQAGDELQEPPNEEEWGKANRISLMDNKLRTLPEAPDCNNLSTLLLQRNCHLTTIPETFFGSMQKLRVLDLHGTGITSLPSSLSGLTRLRALYLNSCMHLNELPSCVAALIQLEVLDIRGTRINYLPIQIGHLIQLRCLRMALSSSGMGHLIQGQSRRAEMNQNVLSSLSLLEELSIDVDPRNQWWDEAVKAITEEVATLTKLTSLSFCFPKVDCLEIFIRRSPSWKDFRFTFQFSVGYHESARYKILDHFDYQICRCLKFTNGDGIDSAISDVIAESEAFELIGHKAASRLSDFGIASFNKMRGCLIEGCNELRTIIDSNGVTEGALKCLEKMYVKNVPKLGSIWEGPVPVGSLARLTTVIFCNCPMLKKIFSQGMIQQLSGLQLLKVEECPEIEEIIMESENNGLEPGALPSLKTLTLKELPKLKSIWKDFSLLWPSLEEVRISECQTLIRLPFNNANATKLILIEGQESWWNALEWQENAIGQRLRSICIFN